MRYLGGKYRLRHKIAQYLESIRLPTQPYYEPFCGACNVVSEMSGERYASDIHSELISLWSAVQSGFRGFSPVTKEIHNLAMRGLFKQHERAFILFGCSFGGKYRGGFVTPEINRRGNVEIETINSLYQIAPKLEGVKFSCGSYDALKPLGALIYCDPPYVGVSEYPSTGKFNHKKFWEWVRYFSKLNTIVVSEYTAPSDFVCIKEFQHNLSVRSLKGCESRIERLFQHESQTLSK